MVSASTFRTMRAGAGLRFYLLACGLWLVFVVNAAQAADPPYEGTVFLDPDIITSSDPTTFESLVDRGRGSRTMYDRRISDWITLDAYLFEARFDDGLTIEVQVNPEFGSPSAARSEAVRYCRPIGQLPAGLRTGVETIWIHRGDELLAAANKHILIYQGDADLLTQMGFFEEALIHEAAHASLDPEYMDARGWLDAQEADGNFISTYARDYPDREDIAESFPPYFAVRYRPERISLSMMQTILLTIPNRLAFFDGLPLDAYPYDAMSIIAEPPEPPGIAGQPVVRRDAVAVSVTGRAEAGALVEVRASITADTTYSVNGTVTTDPAGNYEVALDLSQATDHDGALILWEDVAGDWRLEAGQTVIGKLPSAPSGVVILTLAPDTLVDQPPVANAGPGQTVAAGAIVTLDGSGSSDPEGYPIAYLWHQMYGPAVTLGNADTAQPSFLAPTGLNEDAELVFSLTVNDGVNESAPDTVTITVGRDVEPCPPNGDVDRNGTVTAADALLVFQQALGLAQLTACQRHIADVFPLPNTPDGNITASDALCIFQKALGLPSCLDPLPNEAPIANAGPDQSVDAGTIVTLSGVAGDPDGEIVRYAWAQTGGTSVSLTGRASTAAMFTAPHVASQETLIFRLTVTDNAGATSSDDVSITVTLAREIDVAQYLTGPVEEGWPPGLIAAVIDKDGVAAIGAAGLRKLGSPEEMTVNDLVHIGSNTKAMTSTMLAVLVENGVFPHDWETTIADVFPELLEEIDAGYHAVDLFQLVRMTGGIRPNAIEWWAHLDQADIAERRYAILRDNLVEPPAGPVGGFLYSNLSYVIAGAMAERLTGKSWEALMEEHLFAPLGMTTAGFGPPGTIGTVDQPWGHDRNESGVLTPIQHDNADAMGPAGRVHISIEAWAKFIALWFSNRTPAILDHPVLDELLVPDSDGYAAGWLVWESEWAGGPVLEHAGSNTYWMTLLRIAPDRDIAYLAAANAADALTDNTMYWLLDSIIASLINETLEP